MKPDAALEPRPDRCSASTPGYSMGRGDVLINISTFQGKNPDHQKAREVVEHEAEKMRTSLAHEWESLRWSFAFNAPFNSQNEFRHELVTELGDNLRGKIHDMIGNFDGLEPSVNYTFQLAWEKHAAIKQRMVEFGEKNGQDNVHFGYYLSNERPDQNTIDSLLADVSCEFVWHITVNRTLDLTALKNHARELNIFGFSVMNSGFDLLVYTTGSKVTAAPNGMPENIRRLRDWLTSQYSFLSEQTWYVGLSNYGNKDYGATHSYDEARAILH